MYWLTEKGAALPFAYVERVGGKWWLGGIPHLSGYYDTRNLAIAVAA